MAYLAFMKGPQNKQGIYVADEDSFMLNGTGGTIVAGDVCMLGTTVVDSGTLEFTTVIAPTTAKLAIGLFCVALDTSTATTLPMRVRWCGDVLAKIAASGIAIGAELSATNAAQALKALATSEKSIAINKELTTSTNQIKRVLFNGIDGFGNLA